MEKRFQIFKNNVQFIESFNVAGDKPFNIRINQFPDLHDEEFKALLINGSCWALSAVAAIEGIHQITTSKLMFLSKQKLVDSVKGESEGCIGGYVEDAFEFIVKKGGILSETHYPYKGVNIVEKETHSVAHIKGYEKVPSNNKKALLKVVANQPVSVYIDVGAHAFKYYSSEIFNARNCGSDPNHVVAVVGYGKALDGAKYWPVKNSWGTEWGGKWYMWNC
uniref:Peptidase C1A papain C-terminal domain-containing protein n=1 Tax=Glycine max TaxID=3847 RepID=A0A0R0H4M2_SOYBN